ncbi:MAG: hypothetical protein ACRC3B_12680, partial [Bacteroidia bacterium]
MADQLTAFFADIHRISLTKCVLFGGHLLADIRRILLTKCVLFGGHLLADIRRILLTKCVLFGEHFCLFSSHIKKHLH